jgi:hypothetical protein
MAEDYTDDFIDEEEGGSRRPFWILAGLLSFLLVATIACILIFALSGRNGQQDQRVAEIEATNEAIAAANALVTQTVAAQETEAARPTDPPTATPTPPPATPTTPPTPAPTETPVVQPPEDEDENGDDNGLDEDEADETVLPPTPIFPAAGVATATPVPGTTALPDTGLELWMIPLAVLGLLLVLVAARRLRTAG